MKREKRTETITRDIYVYVADDGKEFKTEYECNRYEIKLKRKDAIDAAEKLKLENFDEVVPLSNEDMNENNAFRWYRMENEEDFDVLETAYNEVFPEPRKYPEIICVETAGYEPYENDAYCYYLSDLRDTTEEFWEKFGYKVAFEKGE